MDSPSKPIISFWQVLGLALLFLSVGIWLSSALAVLIMNASHALGGALDAYLVEEGGSKVMRRCLLGFAIVFLLVFIKRAGWRGWKDCGFATTDQDWSWRPWHAGLLNGIIMGIVTMGAVGALTIAAGIHRLYIGEGLASILIKISAVLISALVVGFFEETVVRGILFRVLARIWRAWPAAILTSLLFSLAHFIEPANDAFTGASFLTVTNAVFLSTFTTFCKNPTLAIQFINLSLLGIVLCAFVIRTKTIWLSVGAHVAWVWMIQLHGAITMFYPPAPMIVWLGKRNDFMDSFMATIMLGALLIWSAARSGRAGIPLRRGGLTWHVLPEAREQFTDWLANHFRSGDACGRILKSYEGCRVQALAGIVWKEYRPVKGWRGWRFGFRPSRTRRAFLTGRRLADCGIPTPTPIAWTTERRFGLRRCDHGIAAEQDQAEPLTDWLLRRTEDVATRAGVMEAYGRLAAGFHRAGFFNRDLKHENVLCALNDPALLWVVDLDGVRRRIWITRRRAARDLRRVGLSLASAGWSKAGDVAAFFKAYNATVPARLRRTEFPG